MKKEELKIGEIYYCKILDDLLISRLVRFHEEVSVSANGYVLVDVYLINSDKIETISSMVMSPVFKDSNGGLTPFDRQIKA